MSFKEIPFPAFRNNLKDFLDLSHGINFISGRSEADITDLIKLVNETKNEQGEKGSLIAYFIWTLAQSIVKHPQMQALKHKDKLVLFNDIDVATMVEKEMDDGTKIPFPYIIRAAQKKSYAEIDAEINKVRKLSFAELKGEKKTAILSGLPKAIRMKLLRRALKNPNKSKEVMGTVGLTNIGSELRGRRFWAEPVTPYTTTMAVGSIYTDNGREMLCLTLKVNHDLIDGVPATRFSQTYIDLLENPTI